MSLLVASLIVLGSLGLIFGVGLAIASKKFYVKIDPKIKEIEEILPNANCGACGYPGCSGYAEAIIEKNADISLCAPGGQEVAHKIAQIMGMEATVKERRIAVIHCQSGGKNNTNLKYNNIGIQTCQAAMILCKGHNLCEYGCLGLNDCVRACPFNAISIDKNEMRIIDEDKCTGCGNCVNACPKNIIELVPISKKVHILCSSLDKGKIAKQSCGSNTACIGCKLCEKKCPVNAITVQDNLAKIDYDRCTVCGLCAEVCPTGAILDKIAGHHPATTSENYNLCASSNYH